MSALLWLTIPLGGLLLALLWVAWTSRTPPRADTHDTVEAHRRFLAAFDSHRGGQREGQRDGPREGHRDDAA